MKANETNFLKFLEGNKQLIIPIYQRPYSWTIKECQQLWNDILQAAANESVVGHFIGSVVYMADSVYLATTIPKLLMIDGQQRFTTISLLLSVLCKLIQKRNEEIDISAEAIKDFYLFNRHTRGNERYKLLLNEKDRDTLISLLEDRNLSDVKSPKLVENYRYFESQFDRQGIDLNSLYRGICKLLIVEVSLERGRDDPQRIFESLNSTGLALSQADLIRNYVLIGLKPDEQGELYKHYWHPMETSFDQVSSAKHFDRFIRDYLTVKSHSGNISNVKEVYSNFKSYVQSDQSLNIRNVVADICQHSKHFVKLAFEQEPDSEIRQLISDINILKVDVAYPFLLKIYEGYDRKLVTRDEFIQILKLVESYVFRRLIVRNIRNNSMNKIFVALSREIETNNYLASIQAAFSSKSAQKRFPNDDEFRREFMMRDSYNFRASNYLLRKLENYGHPEEPIVNIENLTIEHIMPQTLSPEWKVELGEQWKEIHLSYLHTIGNLTLTGYNAALSDRPFQVKKKMQPGGFAYSPLYLNQSLRNLEHWNEQEIESRSAKLADIAIKIWSFPET